MKPFWVEGLFVSKKGLKKAQKTGFYAGGDVEPFAQTIWANTAQEALELAEEKLQGGGWVESPKVTLVSEEKRMRSMGAPELPGFGSPKKKRKS